MNSIFILNWFSIIFLVAAKSSLGQNILPGNPVGTPGVGHFPGASPLVDPVVRPGGIASPYYYPYTNNWQYPYGLSAVNQVLGSVPFGGHPSANFPLGGASIGIPSGVNTPFVGVPGTSFGFPYANPQALSYGYPGINQGIPYALQGSLQAAAPFINPGLLPVGPGIPEVAIQTPLSPLSEPVAPIIGPAHPVAAEPAILASLDNPNAEFDSLLSQLKQQAAAHGQTIHSESYSWGRNAQNFARPVPGDYRQLPQNYGQVPGNYRQLSENYRQLSGDYRKLPGNYRQIPFEQMESYLTRFKRPFAVQKPPHFELYHYY